MEAVDPDAVKKIVADYLKDNPGAGMPPSVQTGYSTTTGFVIRKRTITADRFLASLLKSLGTRRVESIADLVRDFNYDHDLSVCYKPYYGKLDTPGFPRLPPLPVCSALVMCSMRLRRFGSDSSPELAEER